MPEDLDLSIVLCIVAGALAVAAGAFGALHLAPSVASMVALIASLRICWLDDNIANDLLDRRDLPPSYQNARRRQEFLEQLLLGRPWGDAPLTPGIVATKMRAEAQVWSAMLVSGAAAILAQQAPFGPVISVFLAIWVFVLALRCADRLSLTLWRVETGRPLPREDLLGRWRWAYSSREDGER